MATTQKPTLHEIAAMPYPHSVKAMREHYNPMWGLGKDGELASWKVRVNYSYREEGTFFCNVEAVDPEEAEEIAEKVFDEQCPDRFENDIEIDDIEVNKA